MNKLFFLILIFINTAFSKDVDTLKSYRLGEVEITDKKQNISKIKKAEIVDVPYYIIQNSDVMSVSDLQAYIPSAFVRTNSRGESMLFVRGAGERQLGLFFDGMYMNIPWDNRLDLTFVPSDIIGNIRVNKSANSILYGPNVLGGAVSISSIERTNKGYGLNLRVQGGEGNSQKYSVLHDGKIGEFNYITAVSYFSSDGFLMSEDAPNFEYNQNNSSALRSNSFQERTNIYFRGEYEFDDHTTIGASYSFTKQNKGVAPEIFEGEDARFWRYPDRNRNIINLNSEHIFNDKWQARTTFWYDMFFQEINSYNSFAYNQINENQKDEDNTLGTRISLSYILNKNNRFTTVINGFSTNHKEIINEDPASEFSQNTLSAGLEYSGKLSKLEINSGVGIDYNQTPKTGVFEEAEGNSQSDIAGFLSFKYLITDEIAVGISSSRRTRFPTMREQYSGALGKFKVNPDLNPESGFLNELSFIYAGENLSFNIAGFVNLYDDLIERIRLSESQDSLLRRMRVNYAKATISGIDISMNYKPVRNANIDLYFTYLNTQAEQNGEEIKHLSNKPEILSSLIASYRFRFGLKPQFEIQYTGNQYEPSPFADGKFEEIDKSLIFNIRLLYAINLKYLPYTELFIRVNNITDEYYLSQLGLPMPGRTIFAGINLRI